LIKIKNSESGLPRDVTGDLEVRGSRSYRRVTFDDQNETFKNAEEVSVLASPPIEEVLNNEWG